MPKRSAIGLAEVAAWPNLLSAAWRAAKGRRDRPVVQAFMGALDVRLARLQRSILDGLAPAAADRWTVFKIHDPKPRRIVAPCFDDRVLHHALMAQVGPVLDRALIADTFACREGQGSLAAVYRAQDALRRWPWVVKTDVRAYFASIDHERLYADVLARRFKRPALLALCRRILARWAGSLGRGLPIGALTSQYFANSYLDVVDRFACEQLRLRRYVRYMDDLLWWCASKAQARETFRQVRGFALAHRGLQLKPTQIACSAAGVSFLGYRVTPGALRLSQRRRRRYRAARLRWEQRYLEGEIDASELQRGYASALAITRHTDATQWRAEQLRRSPTVDA
jgi:hypothetical protein